MMTGSISRRLLRFAGVLALAGFTVGCASPQGSGPTVAPPDYGSDQTSRAERLVRYCDRLAEKGELITALGLCARAHEINPDDPEPLMKIASLLRSLNRKEAAGETYGALLERHPGHREARYNLGKVYMETGESELAALQFNHVMRSSPEDPRPYNALGIIRDQAGEHEAAQALYRSALKQDPGNFSVRNNLGLSLAMNGQRDEAIEVLAELAVDPMAGPTVMRNLEAAYASRALPVPEQAGTLPGAGMTPAGAGTVGPNPIEPVKTEALETPVSTTVPMKPPAAKTAPAPVVPAQGAPTPLFVPPPSTAGEPQQSGALKSSPSSVILAAAERLMQPPDWADFEPGTLIDAGSPSEASLPGEGLPQSEEIGDLSVDTLDPDLMFEPGEYSLSMLLADSAVSRA